MSKSKRIENRIERIENRFRKKIAKGKKGTDTDIELHERRIKDLKDKIDMNSPLNFGMIPGVMAAFTQPQNSSRAQNAMNMMQNFGGSGLFGSMGMHQWIADRIRKQRQGAGAAQNVAMNIATPDANSVGATGFSSMGGEMYNDPSAQLATGNALDNTITAGMAIGNAPIATVGGFNPAANAAAEGIYGTEVDRATSVSPKKLITL